MPVFDLDLGLHRDGGLTHVLDKGLGPRAWEDVLETSGAYIDIVKLGWGTAYVTPNLTRKLEILKEKPVVIGGRRYVDGGRRVNQNLARAKGVEPGQTAGQGALA